MLNIIKKDFADEMEWRFLYYAKDIITERTLPDVRDGLKPVHRRILYAMHDLGLVPEKGYRKSATVVGEVLGKYHPHGDKACYDSMVRMAQDFSLRYMLVDGHGNFGSIDGDSAAAMRYCLKGSTLVNTDKGLIAIKDIIDSEENSENNIGIKIQSIGNKINNASKFFNSGKHPIKRIVTKKGYEVSGTYNHPILTFSNKNEKPNFEWKLLSDIKINDYIVINKNETISNKNDFISSAEANFLGLMVSEGYLTTQNRIGFSNTDLNLTNMVQSFLKEKFNIDTKIRQGSFTNFPVHEITFCSQKIYSYFMKEYDFVPKSKNKVIPKKVLQSSLQIQKIFLRALFEGDGGVCKPSSNKSQGSIFYSSCSIQLIKQIQIVLLQLGIVSCINKDRDSYKLMISGKRNIKNFKQEINFLSERKKEELNLIELNEVKKNSISHCDCIPYISEYIRKKTIKNKNFINKNNFSQKDKYELIKHKIKECLNDDDFEYLDNIHNLNYTYLPVEYIYDEEEEIVYSIKVDSTCHSFIANGIINHNTEAKLKPVSLHMLKDIEKNVVDFGYNYDGRLKEPSVLPVRFPNLLVNGSDGIAIGMATAIPPHNLNEVINGVIELINNPKITIENLMNFIKAPDFPVGGVITNKENIRKAYETGRGSIEIRSKYHIEEDQNKKLIVFTEIPYQVNKFNIVENIVKKIKEKDNVLKNIIDIRDESDRKGIRLVIEIKKREDENKILARLFKSGKQIGLEIKYGLNMVAIANGKPQILNLKQILEHFIDFQKEIIIRRTNYDLNKTKKRIHTMEGLIKALNKMDEVIDMIKKSKDVVESRINLMNFLDITDIQSDYILNKKLSVLASLETEKTRKEFNELLKEHDEFQKIINDYDVLIGIIKRDLIDIRDRFGDERRTEIVCRDNIEEVSNKDLIEDYNTVLQLTNHGYFKKIKSTSITSKAIDKIKEDDDIITTINSTNKSEILLFTNKRNVYKKFGYKFDDTKQSNLGDYLPNILDLEEGEKVIQICSVANYSKGNIYATYKSDNFIKLSKINPKAYQTKQKRTKLVDAYSENGELINIIYSENDINVMFMTEQGKCGVYSSEKLISKASKDSNGNNIFRITEDDNLVNVIMDVNSNTKIYINTSKDKELLYTLGDMYDENRTYLEFLTRSGCGVGAFLLNLKNKKEKITKFSLKE